MVRRERSRILDDNGPLLLRHQRQQRGKQSRFARAGSTADQECQLGLDHA
jgi:hypothetical protein